MYLILNEVSEMLKLERVKEVVSVFFSLVPTCRKNVDIENVWHSSITHSENELLLACSSVSLQHYMINSINRLSFDMS